MRTVMHKQQSMTVSRHRIPHSKARLVMLNGQRNLIAHVVKPNALLVNMLKTTYVSHVTGLTRVMNSMKQKQQKHADTYTTVKVDVALPPTFTPHLVVVY